ncbi:hypothetical protein TELCIR_19230, partial [Teladorsagia circumcincta]
SHCADEAPAEEIVLSGVDVDANRDERTLTIHGGRDHIRMTLRNIYLAGGASLMPGLAEKLEQELAAIVPNSIHTQ